MADSSEDLGMVNNVKDTQNREVVQSVETA